MSLEHQLAKQLKQQLKLAKLESDMKGEGMYIFQNNTNGDLYLPRVTNSGRRLVRKGEQFLGDSYYFAMLRSNELKLIKEVVQPEQKLLTEQPPTVTNTGPVEYVQNQGQNQINETGKDQPDVLLTETPVDGIKIIR